MGGAAKTLASAFDLLLACWLVGRSPCLSLNASQRAAEGAGRACRQACRQAPLFCAAVLAGIADNNGRGVGVGVGAGGPRRPGSQVVVPQQGHGVGRTVLLQPSLQYNRRHRDG